MRIRSNGRSAPPAEARGATGFDGLDTFLNSDSKTLLIKGRAGTGKTTLALQLLERFGNGRGVYLSTRVPERKIKSDIPWSRRAIGGKEQLHDLRLGNASVLVTDLINSLHKGPVPPIIIFDSWDSIAKELDEKQRLKTEKTIFALADNSPARIVFISEEPERTTMDYLVDGVIELSRAELAERLIREVQILKLRGTPIVQHRYLFTLLGGVFTLIRPYSSPDDSAIKKAKAIPDLEGAYSFGSEELDRVFGGIKKGGLFAADYSEQVPYSVIRHIMLPAVVNFLLLGRGVLLVPLAASNPHEVVKQIERATGLKQRSFGKRFRIQAKGDSGWADPSIVLPVVQTVEEQKAKIQNAIDEVRRESVDKSVLIVQSITALENRFATHVGGLIENLSERAVKISESKDAILLSVQSDSPIRTRVMSMSYDYMTILVKDGSVVVTGEKSFTGAYALHHSQDQIRPVLTQIM